LFEEPGHAALRRSSGRAAFAIFRARDAVDYGEDGPMHAQPLAPAEQEGAAKAAAGLADGSRVKLLYSRPGMSLTYCWFKSGFPLPRHSHSAECLYFIVAGSLRLGSEELGPGDGFFLGRDVPYSYVPGELGVEVLEFRTEERFDIRLLANNPGYWEKTLASLLAAKSRWSEETAPPSRLRIG
jgi:hypothetical protein